MLLIPLDLLLLDRPEKFPGTLISEYTGISPRTAKRIITENRSIRSDTADKAVSNLALYFERYEGLEFDAEGFLSFLSEVDRPPVIEGFGNFIEDAFYPYLLKENRKFKEISDSLQKRFDAIERSTEKPDGLRPVVDELRSSGLPDEMLTEEVIDFDFLENSMTSGKDFRKSLAILRIDISLYLMAAWDVEYGFRLMQNAYGWKPLFARFLPQIRDGKIYYPMALWFDRVMNNMGFTSINAIAKVIPQLSVKDKDQKVETKLRQMRKWRRGETIPTWENIDNICGSLTKLTDYEGDDLEVAKEQGKDAFKFILIFQRLLKAILAERRSHPCLPLGKKKAVEFFERYYIWHNYHALQICEAGI
ncbi:MAG: hypothetical protein V2J65_01415 [Desulfobacteraceae bacterium]|jgi:hypothetical protein|nr:hypothetical protein [Desulfobacteraceae bacterium]